MQFIKFPLIIFNQTIINLPSHINTIRCNIYNVSNNF